VVIQKIGIFVRHFSVFFHSVFIQFSNKNSQGHDSKKKKRSGRVLLLGHQHQQICHQGGVFTFIQWRWCQKKQIREQISRKIIRKGVGGDMFNVRKNPSVKKNVGIGP
jgi:hypothetical protein